MENKKIKSKQSPNHMREGEGIKTFHTMLKPMPGAHVKKEMCVAVKDVHDIALKWEVVRNFLLLLLPGEEAKMCFTRGKTDCLPALSR